MIWLTNKIEFPNYESVSDDGIIALGGDLSAERLICAYKRGIFPWYSEQYPIIWHCPSKRMVLFPEELKVSKSMRKILKKSNFRITENQAFERVIRHCKTIRRKGESGTWITSDMEKAYIELHKLGYGKSIEVWIEEELAGGLYGVDLGSVFCGESMFSRVSNASKIAFIHLAQLNYKLIDCQVHNDHLASLGAREIKREEFLQYLSKN